MNERIKELIERCTTKAMWPGDPDCGDFNKEKFAELIVRECAKIALGSIVEPGISVANARSTVIFMAINKHFGVE